MVCAFFIGCAAQNVAASGPRDDAPPSVAPACLDFAKPFLWTAQVRDKGMTREEMKRTVREDYLDPTVLRWTDYAIDIAHENPEISPEEIERRMLAICVVDGEGKTTLTGPPNLKRPRKPSGF